jgi:hypothetical protein
MALEKQIASVKDENQQMFEEMRAKLVIQE